MVDAEVDVGDEPDARREQAGPKLRTLKRNRFPRIARASGRVAIPRAKWRISVDVEDVEVVEVVVVATRVASLPKALRLAEAERRRPR